MLASARSATCLGLCVVLAACAAAPVPSVPPATRSNDGARLDERFAELVQRHGINTAGAALIHDGGIVWTGYFGEQSPGVPASASTLFNIASITKVFTAETVLRLADAGMLSLDEPMAPHWIDPDIADDPRHRQLTPRIALNHTTGFPNWRFMSPERKLALLHDPGVAYGYSGEGYEYVAQYAQKRLGTDFGDLVHTHLLQPLGIDDAAYSIREDTFGRLAQGRDGDGTFHGHYCRPNGWCRKPGTWSAADDMAITVPDLARFMIAAGNGAGYSEAMREQRERVYADLGDQQSVDCTVVAPHACPDAQGYGLGWQVLHYGEDTLLTHGGSDWSELALAYIHTQSGDGLVIVFNAPSLPALAAMPAAIRLLDPDSPLANKYERWYEKAKTQAN